MRLMIFIELDDNATYEGVPLDNNSQGFGEALSQWIGENIVVPPNESMAAEYNATMAANAAMKDALKQIVGCYSPVDTRAIAEKVLRFIK